MASTREQAFFQAKEAGIMAIMDMVVLPNNCDNKAVKKGVAELIIRACFQSKNKAFLNHINYVLNTPNLRIYILPPDGIEASYAAGSHAIAFRLPLHVLGILHVGCYVIPQIFWRAYQSMLKRGQDKVFPALPFDDEFQQCDLLKAIEKGNLRILDFAELQHKKENLTAEEKRRFVQYEVAVNEYIPQLHYFKLANTPEIKAALQNAIALFNSFSLNNVPCFFYPQQVTETETKIEILAYSADSLSINNKADVFLADMSIWIKEYEEHKLFELESGLRIMDERLASISKIIGSVFYAERLFFHKERISDIFNPSANLKSTVSEYKRGSRYFQARMFFGRQQTFVTTFLSNRVQQGASHIANALESLKVALKH